MAPSTRKALKSDPVLLKIDSIRRSAIFWTMGWGYLWVALAMTAAVFGGVLLDHAFVLQKWGRIAFSRAFFASLGAAVLVASLFPLVKRIGRLYIARRMESEKPELRNALISYLQCRDDPETPGELKLLLRRKAARHIHLLDSHVAVDRVRYLRLGAAVCGMLLIFASYGAVSPKSSIVSVRRLFWPRADILPPTATRLSEIAPGDMYVIRGDEPRLKVRVDGARPQSACAIWDGASFEGRRILLSETGGGLWEAQFPPVLEDGSYYVLAGDTRSDRFGIHALPRPVVEGVQLTLRPPAYTGLPVRRIDGGDADVLSGTAVFVRASTNLPPGRGYMQFDSGRRVWMQVVDGAPALEAAFAALRSDAYSVHFETIRYPNGSSFQSLAPVKFRLVVREDEAPTITLHGPADGVELRPEDAAHVVYSARDDLALAAVRIQCSIGGVARPPVTIQEPHAPRLDRAQYEWELAGIPAPAGSVVTYHLEALDSRPQAPNVGRTETRRIVVLGSQNAPGAAERLPRPGPLAAQAEESKRGERQEGSGSRPETEQRQREERAAGEPAVPGQSPDAAEAGAPEAAQRQGGEPGGEGARDELQQQAQRVAELLGREREATEAGPAGEPGQPGDQMTRGPESAQAEEGAGQSGQQAGGESAPGGLEQTPDQGRGQAAQPGSESDGQAGREGQQSAEGGTAPGQSGEGDAAGEVRQGPTEAGGRPSQATGPAEAQPAGEQGEARPGGGGAGAQASGGGGAGAEQGHRQAESGAAEGAEGGAQAASESGSQGGRSEGDAARGAQAGAGGGNAESGQAPPGRAAGGEGSAARGSEPTGQRAAGTAAAAGPQGHGVRELPPDGAREGPLAVKDLDRAVEELGRLLDEDRVPPRVFDELGMNRQELRRFVDRYNEQRAGRGPQEAGPEAPPPPAEGRIMDAAGPAADSMAVRDALPTEPERDSLRSRFEGAADRLSPRYREVVNRYYEALSEEE